MVIILQSARIRWEINWDSGNWEPLQISWNRKFRSKLHGCISKSMGFSQAN